MGAFIATAMSITLLLVGAVLHGLFTAVRNEHRRLNRPIVDPKRLPHRDDMPFEVVEQMEREIAEIAPGKRLAFMGDTPIDQIPLSLLQKLVQEQVLLDHSLNNRCCFCCGTLIEGYGLRSDAFWMSGKGWIAIRSINGEVLAWVCQRCENAKQVSESEDDDEDR